MRATVGNTVPYIVILGVIILAMPPDYTELKRLIEKQGAMIEENNRMIHKLKRYHTVSLLFTLMWYALLIGLPFALYYYILGPYAEALGFHANLREIPGYGQFEAFFGGSKGE